MLYDLTLPISPDMIRTAGEQETIVFHGHMGTHFDVMNKEFPLDYCVLPAAVFDVSSMDPEKEITENDIDPVRIIPGSFVAFHTGFIETEGYGTKRYFKEHPQFSRGLIELLLEKGVKIIGIDCAGLRRSKEHTPTDQFCADRGTFVIENLCNLSQVCGKQTSITAYTFPLNYVGQSGLPCRVVFDLH